MACQSPSVLDGAGARTRESDEDAAPGDVSGLGVAEEGVGVG
jgi:hypothetical protein